MSEPANRMCAEMRACQGVPTEHLTPGLLRETLGLLREVVEIVEAYGLGSAPAAYARALVSRIQPAKDGE